MKTALFINYSSEPFVGFWDGKSKKFAAGQSLYVPDWLAKHWARSLANRELIKLGKEMSTSPKFPEQVPDFMEQFNKAYIPDEDPEETFGAEKDSLDTIINVANKNRERAKLPEGAKGLEHKKPTDLPEVEEDEGEPNKPAPNRDAPNQFQGKPDENKLNA